MAIHPDHIIHYFHHGLDQLRDELLAYEAESDLWAVAGQINNSAGNLVLHLVGNLQHFIGEGIGNSGYVRDREFEFSAKNVDRATLLQEIEDCKMMLTEVIGKKADFSAPFPFDFTDTPGGTQGYSILRLLTHFYYHLGQVNYHRRLIGSYPKAKG